MSQEDHIDASKLIEAIEQRRIQFFLEVQSAELELKVATQKENNDSNVYILGSFEGAGLDSLYTLKVKIADDPGTPHSDPKFSSNELQNESGSQLGETIGIRGDSDDKSGGSGGQPGGSGGQPGGSGSNQS